jgi:hypothetical protein
LLAFVADNLAVFRQAALKTVTGKSNKGLHKMKTEQKLLLICGILAPLIYVGSDILAALLWGSYSYTGQSVSELRALGAPTRSFLIPILALYALLEIAFGFGIWKVSDQKRALRITAILLIGLGVLDLVAPFFPMHVREGILENGRTLTDTIHIIITGVTVLLIFMIIGFGATANGKWFRIYSYTTIPVLLVCGLWSSVDVPRIEANLPTPWLGVKERINIYGYMLWMTMLAIVLLVKERKSNSKNSINKGTA